MADKVSDLVPEEEMARHPAWHRRYYWPRIRFGSEPRRWYYVRGIPTENWDGQPMPIVLGDSEST